MSFSVNLSSLPSTSLIHKHQLFTSDSNLNPQFVPLESPPHPLLLRASRRVSNGNPSNSNLAGDPRNWNRSINTEFFDDGGDADDGDDEEEDRSLDLLVRFVQNVFKKVSRRARKAVRSVLPPSISTKLVGFSVNGVIVLTFLWVLKAFLEVACTLGTAVFVSILLIRGIWSGITYLQESRYFKINEHDDDHLWSGTHPAS